MQFTSGARVHGQRKGFFCIFYSFFSKFHSVFSVCRLDPRKVVNSLDERDGPGKIKSVAAGNMCSFLVTETGEMWVWGQGKNKTLGIATKENILTPQIVPPETFGNGRIIELAVGQSRCMAITEH